MNVKAGWLLFATVLVYSSIGLLSLNSYQRNADHMLALKQSTANDILVRVEDTIYLAEKRVDADKLFSTESIASAEPMIEAQLIAASHAAQSLQIQLSREAELEAKAAMEEAAILTRKAIENSIEETVIEFEMDQIARAELNMQSQPALDNRQPPLSANARRLAEQFDVLSSLAVDFTRKAIKSGAVVLPRQTAKIDRTTEIDRDHKAEKSNFQQAGYRIKRSTKSKTALTIDPIVAPMIERTNFLANYQFQAISSLQNVQRQLNQQLKFNQVGQFIYTLKKPLQDNWLIDSVKRIITRKDQEILLDINYRLRSIDLQPEVVPVHFIVVIPDSGVELETVLNQELESEVKPPRIPKWDGRFSLVSDTYPESETESEDDEAQLEKTGRRASGRIFRLLRFRRN